MTITAEDKSFLANLLVKGDVHPILITSTMNCFNGQTDLTFAIDICFGRYKYLFTPSNVGSASSDVQTAVLANTLSSSSSGGFAIAGNGLIASGSTVSVKLAATSGLTFTSGSLAVGAGTGISVNNNNVALASSTAGAGLTHTTGVLDVVATDTSLTVAADSIGVNLKTSGGLEIDSGLGIKLAATNSGLTLTSGSLAAKITTTSNKGGLEFDSGDQGLGVKLAATNSGLTLSGGSLAAKITATSNKGGLEFDSADQGLGVKLHATDSGLTLAGGTLAVGAGTGISVSGNTVSLTALTTVKLDGTNAATTVAAAIGTSALATNSKTSLVGAINELVPKTTDAQSFYTATMTSLTGHSFASDYDSCMGVFPKTASLEACCFRYALIKELNLIVQAVGGLTLINDLDCASFH